MAVWGVLAVVALLSCPLPSAPVHCAFIHGAGHASPIWDLGVRQDYPSYWGNLKEVAGCDTNSFFFANTVDEAWYTPRLMHLSCATALAGPNGEDSYRPGSTIRNTVVFTHSMGNLVFAAALKAGHCKLGPSAWWASASSPWAGVVAVDHLMGFCNGSKPWFKELRDLGDILHYCTGTNLSLAYYAMQTFFPGLSELKTVGQRHVDAAMCGKSPGGVPSEYSLLLTIVSKLMQVPVPDDGLVSLDSCQAGAPASTTWGTNYTDLFYIADINHADGTCRNGDSKRHNPAKQPCQWYREVVKTFQQFHQYNGTAQ